MKNREVNSLEDLRNSESLLSKKYVITQDL
jgi:hypothetical protein